MSADLFAEFNSLSDISPASQPSAAGAAPPQQPPQQTPSHDPFAFLVGGGGGALTAKPQHQPQPQFQSQPAFAAQPSQPWPTFSSQPMGGSSWGSSPAQAPAPPKSAAPVAAAEEDDDDGWGDFEVADATNSSAPAPAPAPGATQLSSSSSSSMPWPNMASSPAPSSISPAANSQEPPPVPRIVRATTMEILSNSLVDTSSVPEASSSPAWSRQHTVSSTPKPPVQAPPAYESKPRTHMKATLKNPPMDPNVLFDAEDFELQEVEGEEDGDDEFGDFEAVAPPPPPKDPTPPLKSSALNTSKPTPPLPSSMPSMDLLSLDDPAPPATSSKPPPSQLLGTLSFGATDTSYPVAPKSPSYQDRNPFPALSVKTPIESKPDEPVPKSASPITAWPSMESPKKLKAVPEVEDGDEWAAWDDFPSSEPKAANIDSAKNPESWDWDAVDNVQPARAIAEDNALPPTNIPPPSVILSVFPELLVKGDALFKPVAGQSSTIKQRILTDPKAVNFLQGYVLLATTAARVIAGRKQRWHRDKVLAKSMSISAAGSKGMKLAGVDKTQSVREDREAADVVAAWRQQVGRLRSAVAAAKAAGKASLVVPEISESMLVQTAKMVPTAPKPCVVCGLKREERINKVDHDVEDSFGEWWVEHWGHRACKNFWLEHEQMLRQR